MIKDRNAVLDYGITFGLLIFAFASMFSIALTNAGWVIALLFWIIKSFSDRKSGFSSTPMDVAFILIVFANVVSAIFSVDPAWSFLNSKKIILILIFYIIYKNVYDTRTPKLMVALLSVSAVVVSAIVYYQYLIKGVDRAYGTSGPQTVGLTLLIAIFLNIGIFVFYKKMFVRILTGIMIVISSVAVLFTMTRTAWIGFAVALVIMGLIARRKTVIIIACAICVLISAALIIPQLRLDERIKGTFDFSRSTGLERVSMWKSGLMIMRDFAFTGCGQGCIQGRSGKPDKGLYPKYSFLRHDGGISDKRISVYDSLIKIMPHGRNNVSVNPSSLHNDFINTGAETGMLGLGVMIYVFVLFFRHASAVYGQVKEAFSKAIVFGSMGGAIVCFVSGFGDSEVQMLLWFVMALTFVVYRSEKSAQF